MKALKGLWLMRSNTKSDLHTDKDVVSIRNRAGSTAGPKQPDSIPRLRAIRADTSPDLFGVRNRSGSSGSAGGSPFVSGASYGSGSYLSDETGTDSSDSEPFQPRPSVIVAPTPSFFQDTVDEEDNESQEGTRVHKLKGSDRKASSSKLKREKEKEKEREKEKEKEKEKARDKEKKDRERDREKSKNRHEKGKDKNGKPIELNLDKILDAKGDFDPSDQIEREVVYADSLAEFDDEITKKLKKSRISDEKFEQNFETLLRVLSFVSKSNKLYRRRCWGPPIRREKPNTIFLEPGKSLKFPEQLDLAREKLCKQEDPKQIVKFGEFEGRGGFGRVFAGRIKNPHNAVEKARVAVKVMPHKSDKELRMNFNEVGMLTYFNHPNIVKFLRCYSYADELWVLMEFLEGGTLREATQNFQFSEAHIAYVAKEMLQGLAYLHQLQIAHRDLKSGNVMLSMKAEVKLIDFGLCADFSEKKEAIHMCGSPFWMSPEMINQRPHSLSTDIWSLAVCLVEMVNRKVPHNRSIFKAMFLVGSEGYTFSPEEYKWSPEFHDMISQCLQMEPTKRPTAAQLLQHPFLKKAATLRQMQSIMPAIFLSNTMTRQGLL